jgi:cytochrome c-type biogenesis protein CcmH
VRIVVVLVAALALVAPAAASERHPTLSELEGQVMCPVCKTTLDMSQSPAAERIRVFIRQRIAAGDTRSRIKAELVDQFGPAILAEPPKKGFDLLAWVVPLGGLLAAALAIAIAAWRWSRVRGARADERPLDAESDRRVDEALASFDG